MCLRRIGALVLLLASAAHGASRVVFNPADASEGPVCILGKGYDNLTASCDIALSSGASVQGNADAIEELRTFKSQMETQVGALKALVCQNDIGARTAMSYSASSTDLLNGFCPVACESLYAFDAASGECVRITGPVLENPTDVGGGVQTFCGKGCQLSCPAGAKGPGWHIPGGTDDANAELRWDGVELNYNYFTVAMWVNLDNENSDIGLFSYGDFNDNEGFMVQMRSVHAHDFHIRADSAASPGFGSYDSASNLYTGAQTVGTWFHVAVVKNGDNDIRFYINGAQVGSNTAFAGKPSGVAANRRFNVGSWFEDGKILHGYVSNIHVFTSDTDSSQAYSDSEMQNLYSTESGYSC